LARHHWRALRAIGNSGSAFEPLARYRGVGSRIAAWLAERGLVEIGRGPQDRRFGLCYRITALGRMVLERGRAPSS
jgi:DNA-binding MarR family transcriptional regulator